MAFAFDTLGFAKRLRDKGIPAAQAEAHAEAARDFIMAELATRTDLLALKTDLRTLKQDFQLANENLRLALTIRMGAMTAAGIVLLGALIKLG
jgi:hypothetical protein